MSFTTARRLEIEAELPPAYSIASSSSPGPASPSSVRFADLAVPVRSVPEDVTVDDDILDLRRPTYSEHGVGPAEPVRSELPPSYTHFDEYAKVFSMCNGIINIVNADRAEKPRYQLKQQLAKSGRLWRLQIRRLLPSESRRLSMSSRDVDFDADTMLYDAENLAALYALRNRMEVQIKGRKAGTLQGHIEVRDKGRDGHEFLQCTRPASKHWSREENMKKMNRWGWRADDELEKTSLFTRRSLGRGRHAEWKHKDELTDVVGIIAVEMDGELVLQRDVPDKLRDALVTCWATKHWMMGTLDSGKPDVRLSRWLTVS